MNFTYENQGTNTYLVYEIGPGDELDSMSLGMLTNNDIPGFAVASFTQMDTTKYIKFNVSSKVSVAQLFSGPVNKKRLLGVFEGIVDAMLSAEDYMLDPAAVLLDLDHIYTDVSTCETVLVCLPILNNAQSHVDLSAFFKNIIFKTQFDQTENCDHVAQILNYLNSTPVLSLVDFKEILHNMSKTGIPVIQTQTRVDTEPAQPAAPVQPSYPVPQPAAPVTQVTIPAQQPVRTQQETVPIFDVPQPQSVIPPKQEPVQTQPDEKPMSMFYLLQHYNKENAAKYKAQQEAKKNKKNNAVQAPPKKQKKESAKAAPQASAGFAIPGQAPAPISSGFDIPGAASQPVASSSASSRQPTTVISQPVVSQPPAAQPVNQQPVYTPPAPSINFGETMVLSAGMNETTVLNAQMDVRKNDPHLIRMKNNEKIPLNKPVFRIGKERSYVDYFISDNTAISRSHANIINNGGRFVIVDTNSTNHTYVNGCMIQSNQEVTVEHGTKIRLANEDFEFRMY